MPGSVPSSSTRPSRTADWSSATITVTGPARVLGAHAGVLQAYLPFSVGWPGRQRAPALGRALPQAGQPVLGTAGGERARRPARWQRASATGTTIPAAENSRSK